VGEALRASVDEVEIAGVDEEPCRLADDEHGVGPVDRVGQERRAPADREEPEGAGHDALPRALGSDPLDEEAGGEERLAEQSDTEPHLFRGHRDNPSGGVGISVRWWRELRARRLRGAAEHRAEHVVSLANVLRAAPARHEREDLLGVLGRDCGGLVADVGEVAQRDFQGDGHVVEAVDRDRLLTALDLADELAAQAGALAETFLAQEALLAEGAETLAQELSDVLDGPLGHEGRILATTIVLLAAGCNPLQAGSVPPVMIARTRAPSRLVTVWTQPGGRRA